MKQHFSFLFIATAIGLAGSAHATTTVGVAGLGADTLALPGIHATVDTGTVGIATRTGNLIGVLRESMGSGDGVHLDGAAASLGYSSARSGVIAVMPELQAGMLSVTGPDFTGAHTGYVMGGLVITDQANAVVGYDLEALDGSTFAADSSSGDGSGRAYKVGVGISESLTQRVMLTERFTDSRLTVGNGAIVDHAAMVSVAERF